MCYDPCINVYRAYKISYWFLYNANLPLELGISPSFNKTTQLIIGWLSSVISLVVRSLNCHKNYTDIESFNGSCIIHPSYSIKYRLIAN